ncbi:MAG: Lrp/AsnC family transcriptional regulator [Candidatus ainarchaeum sp.]|nr:Lrp/AsnC family transcriptional regulator [Candidatus ainarchaeum sp.]
MTDKLDEKDFAIIEELKKNSKLSEQKIAKKAGIPMTTVHNRIAKLRKEGVIENFTIRLNYAKIGKPIIAFVLLKAINQADQKLLVEQISKIPNVYEVAMVTGEFDILFKARVASMDELKNIVVSNLREQKNVGESETMVCYEMFERI